MPVAAGAEARERLDGGGGETVVREREEYEAQRLGKGSMAEA
jgi:hypothetical protein